MTRGLLGFGLGWLGSMPLAGPVSLFVLRRGVAGRYRDGISLAGGAAAAEAAYCAVAISGYGLLLDRWPAARPVSTMLGALIMVGVGVYLLLARHPLPAGEAAAPAALGWPRDLALGFSLVGFNPMVVVNWLAVLAALHAVGVTVGGWTQRLEFVGGVALGITCWFSLLTWLLHHGRSRIRPRVFQRVISAFGGILCLAGIYALVTAFS